MPRTPDNLVRHELIGLPVSVVRSTDDGKTGINGRVIDETRQTIIIQTDTGETRVPKAESVFHFTLETGEVVEIDGTLLVARPEERTLKKFPRKWEYTNSDDE